MIDIGNRVKQLRKRLNISANKLSQELQVHQTTISKVENNKAIPSLDLVVMLCEFFDITPSQFFDENYIPSSTDTIAYDSETHDLLNALENMSSEQKDALYKFLSLIDTSCNK